MRSNASAQTFGAVLAPPGDEKEPLPQVRVSVIDVPQLVPQNEKQVHYTYNEQSVGKILSVNTHFDHEAIPRITEYYSEKRSVTPDACTQSLRKNAALSKYLNGANQ